MTKPINTKIPPTQSVSVAYTPGVPVYTVKIFNHNVKETLASISYDRASGTLSINIAELLGV